MNQSQEFARSLPRGLDAIGGPACPPSPGGAATFNQQQHRSRHDAALGRAAGSCRVDTSAVEAMTFVSGTRGIRRVGCRPVTKAVTVMAACRSLNSSGIEAGTSHLVAINHHRRKGRFQAVSQRLPDHFKNLRFNAHETSDGARGSVLTRTGELPSQGGERQHVTSR